MLRIFEACRGCREHRARFGQHQWNYAQGAKALHPRKMRRNVNRAKNRSSSFLQIVFHRKTETPLGVQSNYAWISQPLFSLPYIYICMIYIYVCMYVYVCTCVYIYTYDHICIWYIYTYHIHIIYISQLCTSDSQFVGQFFLPSTVQRCRSSPRLQHQDPGWNG